MRKNNGKLITAVVCALIISCLSIWMLAGQKKKLNLDLEYGDVYELVYTVDSSDNEKIQNTVATLEQRIRNFGALDLETTVNGSEVTIRYTGVTDNDNMRKFLTQTGHLTLRNTKDELIVDENVFKGVGLLTGNDKTYLSFVVDDATALKEATAKIATSSDKLLVAWSDFAEGDKYETESKATAPKYLSVFQVTSGISESFYVESNYKPEDLRNAVCVLNGGSLKVSVAEKSFRALTPAEAGNKNLTVTWLMIVLGMALSACWLIFRFGAAGGIAAIATLGWTAAYYKATSLLGINFGNALITIAAALMAAGLLPLVNVLNKFRNYLLRGRNQVAAMSLAYKEGEVTLWESHLAELITGVIALICFRNTLADGAYAVIIGAGCSLVFFNLLTRLMLNSLLESGYAEDKKLFAIKTENLPDVEKGEEYVAENRKVYDYTRYFTNLGAYIAAAIAFVMGVIGAFRLSSAALVYTLIMIGVIAILAALYTQFRYHRQYPLLAMSVVIITSLALLGINGLFVRSTFIEKGVILAVIAAAAGYVLVFSGEIRRAFREIWREKLNEGKLLNLLNGVINTFAETANTVLLACILYSAAAIYADGIGIIALCTLVTIYLGGKLWFDYEMQNIDRKPAKKNKKNNKKELKETTIFGINEVK